MSASLESSPLWTRKNINQNVNSEVLYKRAKTTISAASRLLRRKIPQSGHLMTSKRFWMQSIPDQDVDVVVTFPHNSPESNVLWLKAQIEKIPGINIRTKPMTITKGTKTRPNCFSFHLSASYHGYLKGLESMQVPKAIKEEYGGGMKEFTLSEAQTFQNIEDLTLFLTSQERQAIINYQLNSLRAEAGDQIGKLKFREGEAIISRSLSAKILYQVFPIHDQATLKPLQSNWVKQFLRKQPMDDICDYFGVQIALYFAWLGHYTKALCIPAIVGFLFWFFFYGRAEFLEDIGFVIFSFFNVIWATLYLESWKRRSSELAYTWGTADQRDELLVEPRPQFKGTERISEITGKPELYYPEWKRNAFRYFVTVPVIGFCLVVVCLSVFLILELQQWWDIVIKEKGYLSFLSYLPKILLAVVIPILDSIYNEIAIWLNDKENYRNAAPYENNMVVKIALFQFVNSFLALFYIAFYLQDMDKLKELLAALLITRQVMGNIKEALIPYFQKEFKLAMMSFDLYGAVTPSDETAKSKKDDDFNADQTTKVKKERTVTQAELESSAPPYEGTFEDFLEMFIQFGYVTLFSSAYPLAGLCALLNNMIEIRGDAFKLCFVHRRPFGARVNSIGSWQNAMELMGIVGVLVNCALIGLSGQVQRMFPNITSTQTILFIIILEHVMLMLKYWIAFAIPDIPSWVATEMAKIEWRRRETEKLSHALHLTASTSLDTVEKSVQTESISTPSSPEREGVSSSSTSSSHNSMEVEQFREAVSQSKVEVFGKSKPHEVSQKPQLGVHLERRHSRGLKEDRKSNDPLSSSNGGCQPIKSKLLCQRMASDTDLWMNLKAAQAKYQSKLDASKETTSVDTIDDMELVVNQVDMPSLCEYQESELAKTSHRSQATPPDKRQLNQEEFDRRFKAKRALFSGKGRSLSIASFSLPASVKKVPKFLPLVKSKPSTSNNSPGGGSSKKKGLDEKCLIEHKGQGELEILGLESLIDVEDLRKKSLNDK